AYLAAQPPAAELSNEIHEHLIGDLRERRADPSSGGELRDQNRGLPDDGMDQKLDIHRSRPAPPLIRATRSDLGGARMPSLSRRCLRRGQRRANLASSPCLCIHVMA